MKVNKINVSGPVDWVHGIEKTRRRKKTGEVGSSRNFGTNIFVNRNGQWLMVFHQAAEIRRNPDLMPCRSDCSKSAFGGWFVGVHHPSAPGTVSRRSEAPLRRGP